jgi:hypothetical protein
MGGVGSGPAARVPPAPARAAHPRAMRRGVLPPGDPVREHRRAEAASATLSEDGNLEINGPDMR